MTCLCKCGGGRGRRGWRARLEKSILLQKALQANHERRTIGLDVAVTLPLTTNAKLKCLCVSMWCRNASQKKTNKHEKYNCKWNGFDRIWEKLKDNANNGSDNGKRCKRYNSIQSSGEQKQQDDSHNFTMGNKKLIAFTLFCILSLYAGRIRQSHAHTHTVSLHSFPIPFANSFVYLGLAALHIFCVCAVLCVNSTRHNCSTTKSHFPKTFKNIHIYTRLPNSPPSPSAPHSSCASFPQCKNSEHWKWARE